MTVEKHDGFEWHTEHYVREEGQEDTLNVAQRMYDHGLIWLANRTLHPFGFAIGVTVNEGDKVTALNLHYSTDSEGVMFGEDLEMRGRHKFYKALRVVFSRTLGG